MKFSIYTCLFGWFILLNSCTNSVPEQNAETQTNEIVGRWKLSKEEQKDTKSDGVAYSKQPTIVVLNLQPNGYFQLYDTITNKEWVKKGLPLIQERSRGQWSYEGKKLVLNHSTKDTSYTEQLTIEKLDKNQMITKGSDQKSRVYKTYGK